MRLCVRSSLSDLSLVRPVPDHQEVFSDGAGLSLSVDINEAQALEPLDSAKTHWEDLAFMSQAQAQIMQSAEMVLLERLKQSVSDKIQFAVVVRGAQSSAKDQVQVRMLVLRLDAAEADVILTICDSGDKDSTALEREFWDVVESLEFLNLESLFGVPE